MIDKIKRSKSKQTWLAFTISGIGGFICAFYSAEFSIDALGFIEFEFGNFYITFLLLFIASMLVQTTIHEVGHMIFGMITGYKFHSIRILLFMLYKKEGKLKFTLFGVPGTSGQCIMIPPEAVYDENGEEKPFPYILYNLGGAILNLVSVPLFILLLNISKQGTVINYFLFYCVVMGVVLALTNGIPMKLAINNDGMNIISIYKDKRAVKAYRTMIKLFVQILDGKYYKDMPEELFTPEDEDVFNPVSSYIPLVSADRALALGNFEEAKSLCETLILPESRAVDSYKNTARLILVYIVAIGDAKPALINVYLNRKLEKLMKRSVNDLNVLRTRYAFELLINCDEKAAAKTLKIFNQIAKKSKYPKVIETERFFYEYIDKIHSEKTISNS